MRVVRTSAAARGGYTLVELLVALALFAVLAGVTIPSALRIHADSRLSEVAEQVRAQLAGTRVRSIESGLAYQFRFEADGRHYASVPFEREFEGSNANATGTGGTTGVGRFTRFAGQLPSGFHFNACCTGANAKGAQLEADAFGDLPNASELAGVDWSPPLLFFADGAGVDASFEVADARGQAIRLQVRGLTGATTMSGMRPEAGP